MPSFFKKLLKLKAPLSQKRDYEESPKDLICQQPHRSLTFPTSEFVFTFRATCTAEVSLDPNDLLDAAATGKWRSLTWEALSTGAHYPSRYKQKPWVRGHGPSRDDEHRLVRNVPVPTLFVPAGKLNDAKSLVELDVIPTRNRPFRFLNLPPEIRNEVYSLLLSPGNKIKPYTITWLQDQSAIPREDRQTPALHPNVLRISKQIYLEAATVLYERNTFEFWHTPAPFINPVKSPFYGQFTPWTNIRHLIIRHIKPRHGAMPHTKTDWITTLNTRFRIREMPHLQTVWLQFPISAEWAVSPQQIIQPIVDALEATSAELVPPFTGDRLGKLKIVSVAWIQGFHGQIGWTANTAANRGTVCVGLVTGDRKMPSYFSPMKSFDQKVWDAHWGEFRGLKVPWIFKRPSATDKKI
jgi:hypothetical protein